MAQMATLLAPLGLQDIGAGGGGPDIDPIAQAGNVPALAYLGDASRLFLIHHTAADTVERIAPEELSKAAAAIAAITYVVADMPERIPRTGATVGSRQAADLQTRLTCGRPSAASSVSVDVEDARAAGGLLPLHQNRALIGAFDDAAALPSSLDTSRLTERRMPKKRAAGTASVRASTLLDDRAAQAEACRGRG